MIGDVFTSPPMADVRWRVLPARPQPGYEASIMPAEGPPKDHYEVLEVPSSADEEAIRKACARLSTSWSQRVSMAASAERRAEAETRLREVAEARMVLLTPAKRAVYDQQRASRAGLPGLPPVASPVAPSPSAGATGLESHAHAAGMGPKAYFFAGTLVGAVALAFAVHAIRPASTERPPASGGAFGNKMQAEVLPAVREVEVEPSAATPRPRDLSAEATLTASSFKTEGRLRHVPSRAADGRLGTAWEEGAAGPGIGEWLEFDFREPRTLTRFGIVPGYAKYVPDAYGDRFKKNLRVKAMTLAWDGGQIRVELRDDPAMQFADLPNVRSRRLRLRIEAVYPAMWADVCISEARIWGY